MSQEDVSQTLQALLMNPTVTRQAAVDVVAAAKASPALQPAKPAKTEDHDHTHSSLDLTSSSSSSGTIDEPEPNMCLYVSPDGKWLRKEAPEVGDTVVHRVRRDFWTVCLYYAQLIDYTRVVMAVGALVLILHAPDYKWTIAVLIFGDTLLDWVDGPVARHYGQSSVMGCGWDWLADILTQYALAMWCMQLSVPIATFVVLFTTVEIATGLFDFALSAAAVYPLHNGPRSWYNKVEDLIVPDDSYSKLGIVTWLVNTTYPISYCVGLPQWVCWAQLPFALLYAWHEVAQLILVVTQWKETSAELSNGVDFQRMCSAEERTMLQEVLAEVQSQFTYDQVQYDDSTSAEKEEQFKNPIVWFNLYRNGKSELQFRQQAALQSYVERLVQELYFGKPRYILSYGFIVARKHGDVDQQWHIDYGKRVSNLFIPMSHLTIKNATQFVRGAIKSPMPHSNCYPDPYLMLKPEGRTHMEVVQCVSEPFSILKLHPSVMHRGIANHEDYDRILFFVSTNDVFLDLGYEHFATKAASDVEPDMALEQERAKSSDSKKLD